MMMRTRRETVLRVFVSTKNTNEIDKKKFKKKIALANWCALRVQIIPYASNRGLHEG